MNNKIYDNIIVGGGLAGLSLAILLAQKGYIVLVIEKKLYPFHKVCGEYISMESWDFLVRLGIPLEFLDLPKINHFEITASNGAAIQEDLDMGGFGISRFSLDKLLAERAKESGAIVLEQTICSKYEHTGVHFRVHTNKGIFQSKIVCASFGRHASGNFHKAAKASENWIGVKYHIELSYPDDNIALHTFRHGYCGISKVDNNRYCLCYLVKASLLNRYKNDIKYLEESELYKNLRLKAIFEQATFLFAKPLTISNITFEAKQPVVDHVFYLGDSAGAIAPLTGNGMSNAMRSAWLLSLELDSFFQNRLTRKELEANYLDVWNHTFRRRILMGRFVQFFFCNPLLTPFFIMILNRSKWLRKSIMKQAHGERF